MNNPSVYQVNFKDGRIFRVLCLNPAQKQRLNQAVKRIEDSIAKTTQITNGIHGIGDFEGVVNEHVNIIDKHNLMTFTDEDPKEIISTIGLKHPELLKQYLDETI